MTEKKEINTAGLEWGAYSICFDYEYRPAIRNFFFTRTGEILLKMIEDRRGFYNHLIAGIAAHRTMVRKISFEQQDEINPFWDQNWFTSFDALFLYGLLNIYKPARYIEIGSGNSTRFARRAITDNQLSTKIICIDPEPRTNIDGIADTIIRKKVEDIAHDELMSFIRPGDMILIDSSHRSFQASDTTVCFTELIPALPEGVIYGIHDIFLPFDYPKWFSEHFYNEQYLLLCYLLGGAASDEILLPTWYISNMKEMALPLYDVFDVPALDKVDKGGSTFWMKKG